MTQVDSNKQQIKEAYYKNENDMVLHWLSTLYKASKYNTDWCVDSNTIEYIFLSRFIKRNNINVSFINRDKVHVSIIKEQIPILHTALKELYQQMKIKYGKPVCLDNVIKERAMELKSKTTARVTLKNCIKVVLINFYFYKKALMKVIYKKTAEEHRSYQRLMQRTPFKSVDTTEEADRVICNIYTI